MSEAEKKRRAAQDTVWWAERFAKIINKSGRKVPLVANAGQRELDRVLEEQRAAGRPMRAIILKARQVGMSTWTQAKLVQRATQRPNYNTVVVAHNRDTGSKLYAIGETIYANLPEDVEGIKPPLGQFRRKRFLHFTDASREAWMRGEAWPNSTYTVDTAGEYQAGRGGTHQAVHASEVAFWDDIGAKLNALKASVPRDPETMFVIESTANGGNEFKDMWDDAVAGRGGYAPVFWPWWRDEGYSIPFLNDAEREAFEVGDPSNPYAEEEPDLLRNFDLTPEQLNWRRHTIADESGGDLRSFHQEYPACLTSEQRVSTERGIIPISEAGEAKRTESGAVKRWGLQPASPVYRLTTLQGRVLRGTADHPVQTEDGLVELAKLKPGARVVLREPMFADRPCRVTWDGLLGSKHHVQVTRDLSRLLGYFMGDGSWHRDTLEFVCDAKDEDVVADVAKLLTKFVGSPGRKVISRTKGRKGAIALRVTRKDARTPMERLGLLGTNGSGSWRREVCVPEVIWRSPRPVVREFLRGLFEADGSASARKVRFASCRLEFARDVQLLLLGFGLNAALQENPKRSGNGASYMTYVLDITTADSRRFHDLIGFVGKRKQGLRPEPLPMGRPARPRPLVDEVAGVEADGCEVTYDFALDTEDHLFTAQGILTHNTPDEAFIATGRRLFDPYKVAGLLISCEMTDPMRPTPDCPGPARGSFQVASAHTEVGRVGPVEVPDGVAWVPRSEGPAGVDFWRMWEGLEEDEQGMVIAPPGRQYVIGGDVSGGQIEEGQKDPAYHVLQVIDHASREQVAEYHSRIDPDLIALEALLAALFFNKAWVAIERTGGWGGPALRRMWFDYHYPYTYRSKKVDQTTQKTEKRLGWDTTPRTKPIMEAGMKELLRTEETGIRSRIVAAEMNTYVIAESGKTGPERGKFSDALLAYMIAQQVAREIPLREASASLVTAQTFRAPSTLEGYDNR